jgi:hypothetical protein
MSKAGDKILAGMREAVAIAKGEAEPARVHHGRAKCPHCGAPILNDSTQPKTIEDVLDQQLRQASLDGRTLPNGGEHDDER